MKEGIVALLLQWSSLCLVWMGALDKMLAQVKLSRRKALAALTAFLVCSVADWRVAFLPVELHWGGAVLPLLFAGVVWLAIRRGSRLYVLAAAGFSLAILFFVRKLLFWDPVLMVVDERLLVPALLVLLVLLLTRSLPEQLLVMLVAFPLSDALYTLSFSGYGAELVIGAPAAQDLLWVSLALWGCANAGWLASRGLFAPFAERLLPRLRWRTRPPSRR